MLRYRALLKFAARERHARVPQGHVESGLRLGQWVSNQRVEYARDRLSAERRRYLEAVPGWAWRVRRTPVRLTFEQAETLLRRFVRREGHARVPSAHGEEGIDLGTWVERQRIAFRRGRLPANRVRRLERLPGWTWDPLRDSFERMLGLLRRLVRREGHARVPHGHREAGAALGWWVAGRRRAYQEGVLAKEDVAALESLPGWTWDARLALPVDRMLEALARFVRREGHAHVPPDHRERGLALGGWLRNRRTAFREGRLSPSLARQLERFPGWRWNPYRDRFQEMLALLRGYVRREGHARVPITHVEEGYPLGAWVAYRRAAFHSGRVPRRMVAELAAVPGWTWRIGPTRPPWEKMLAALRAFVRREGHSRVPKEHRERGLGLGAWVAKHRDRYRRGRLGPAHVRELERLPGWSWRPREDGFALMFRLLGRYAKREGHARVPRGHCEAGVKLGHWVDQRRGAFRKGGLSAEAIAALEALPGWTWRARAARKYGQHR